MRRRWWRREWKRDARSCRLLRSDRFLGESIDILPCLWMLKYSPVKYRRRRKPPGARR
jgi:hypothetical protein